MRRSGFVGIAVVAVVALALTAASVETLTVGSSPDIEGSATPGEGGPSGCVSNASDQPDCASGEGGSGDDTLPLPDSGGATPPASTGPALWQVVASVALFTLGGVAIVYGLTRGDGTDRNAGPEDGGAGSSTVEAAPARQAADVAPTNGVYRSWLALRQAADADAAASPAEVADTAVTAGFDEAAVDALTHEFCTVRYGPGEPTPDSEARARTLAERLGLEEVRD